MAIITLPLDVNVTPGGIWAIASEDVACAAFVSVSGNTLTITEPVTTSCNIILSYTVTSGACQDISTHEVQITPKTCISIDTGIAIPSDWQLNLAPLTINGALQDNFAYAIVPENDDCTTYNNAVAWGYKGSTCLSELPDDLTPKTNFDPLPNVPITTFQVPAGDYKLVVVCSDHTLGTCEKIDCCGVNVTVTDLDLCSVYSSCVPLTINYPLNPANFTINIPMVVEQDKCVRMDFNGGGAVADTIELQVLTTTGWEYVELDPLNINTDPLVSTYQINTAGTSSIVVRAAGTALIPGTPYLPANSILFGAQYKLNWVISRAGSNGTSWYCDLSCCDCLPTCPPVQYSCINSVIEVPVPICDLGCSNLQIEGSYSKSVADIAALIDGSCSTNSTCLGSLTSNTGTITGIGVSSYNSTTFTLHLAPVYSTEYFVNAGTLCAVNRYELPFPITYTLTATQNIINYTVANISIYNAVKSMILGLPTDKSNYSLYFSLLGDTELCNDSDTAFKTFPTMYFVENGVSAVFTWNDADCIITIDVPITAAPDFSCVSALEIGSSEPEYFVCKSPRVPFTTTGSITLSSIHAYIYELLATTSTNSVLGNLGASTVCPALWEESKFIVMDPANPTTTWLYTAPTANGPTCLPLYAGPSVIIYQHALGLDPNQAYGNFQPIASGGCVGWRNTLLSRNYTIDSGNTGVGFGNCYTP